MSVSLVAALVLLTIWVALETVGWLARRQRVADVIQGEALRRLAFHGHGGYRPVLSATTKVAPQGSTGVSPKPYRTTPKPDGRCMICGAPAPARCDAELHP